MSGGTSQNNTCNDCMNLRLGDLPCEQTLCDITGEAHYLTKVQVAEKLTTSNFTLHCDGTSRSQRKYLGYQVTLDSGETLSLGFVDAACEDAASVLDITVILLKELGEVLNPNETENIFRQILQRLHSKMTDRTSVMKKFSSELNVLRQESLSSNEEICFLHCNTHFLLGLGDSCETSLKTIEEKPGW